jgi:hypothetical protein
MCLLNFSQILLKFLGSQNLPRHCVGAPLLAYVERVPGRFIFSEFFPDIIFHLTCVGTPLLAYVECVPGRFFFPDFLWRAYIHACAHPRAHT